MIGSALVAASRNHIRIEALELMLPPAGRRIVVWLANSLTIAFSLILLWASIELMDRSWFQQAPMLEVPKWTVYMAIAGRRRAGSADDAAHLEPGAACAPTGRHRLMIGLMLVLFLVFMLLGMPIAYCMALAAILSVLVQDQLPVLILAQQFYDSLDNFSLLAVPLFVLAGELMSVAGITERLVNLSRALIGHFRGGLAQANILTNMFMGAISGSALADLTAIGSMMIPAMKREGYKPSFAVAVTACAAMMAPIIPPSIIAVIYGSVTGVSIGALFLGGVIPGVLAGVSMLLMAWWLAPRAGAHPSARATWRERGSSSLLAVPAIIMPVIIIGGILSGAFTPTEAGGIAAFYALLFGLFTRPAHAQDPVRQFRLGRHDDRECPDHAGGSGPVSAGS
jgi:hypothetical protein